MNTKIFKINRDNIDNNLISQASNLITEGQLVAFPTETVYGLGANGLDSNALSKIYEAKGRPSDNPLILHISNIGMLYNLVESVSQLAIKLIEKYWPGPLTLIFKKKDIIPDIVSGGLDTVAVRFPSDEIARMLIDKSNVPIAAPSANISGRPSPTKACDVLTDMDGRIPLILDGGDCQIGIESTVIDLSDDVPIILRPGYYTYEDIKSIIPNVILDDSLVDDKIIPRSPGQKYTHYAPVAKMEVYVGDNAVDLILDKAKIYSNDNYKVGILAFDDSIDRFKDYYTISLGDRGNLIEMSQALFTSLRSMDYNNIDIILAEGVEDIDLGKSIMNRMKKSASGNVFYV